MADKGVAISDLIVAVSDGIRDAKQKSKDKEAVLQLSQCEIELAVNVSVEGKAGLRFWIIEAGAGGATETASRIKLSFSSTGDSTVFVSEGDNPGKIPNRQARKKRGSK